MPVQLVLKPQQGLGEKTHKDFTPARPIKQRDVWEESVVDRDLLHIPSATSPFMIELFGSK
jgi:hypothetical protein